MSKLRFKVCYCSGEDPEFPAEELNTHSPHTKGWQSYHICDDPQELGFAWESPARVTQVQILSHESKIATKIELFVGHGDSYESAQFRRLGYLSLNSNEGSNYAARELKSVYVNAPGHYLRMLIHKCHINELNVFNQIGIVAVNIIGEELGELAPGGLDAPKAPYGSGPRSHPSYTLPTGGKERGLRVRRPSYTEMNDLSFDFNFDPDTAQQIRDIAAAKERAVLVEDYDKAKLLKEAETRLKSLGQQLAQLYFAKKQAVQDEDYDRAKMLKMEADTLRLHIDAHHNDDLHANYGEGGKQDDTGGKDDAPIYSSFNAKSGETGDKSPSPGGRGGTHLRPQVRADDRPIASSMRESGQARRRSGDEGFDVEDSGTGAVDDGFEAKASPPKLKPRTLHSRKEALPHARPRESWEHEEDQEAGSTVDEFPPGEHPLEGVPKFEDLAAPETLSAKVDLSEVQGLNSLFGEYITRCLYSKTWSLREAAIFKIKLMLPSLEEDPGINSALTEICQVLRVGFEDKIAQVFVTTLDLLEAALLSIEKCREARHNHVVAALEPTVATLLGKLGDGQSRLRDGAMKGLGKVARCRTVGPSFVSHVALKPLVKKQLSAWRPITLRLHLLTQLVREFGLEGGSELATRSIMGFVKSCNGFAHSNGEVRDAARELTVELHGIVGSDIEPYLTCLRPKQLDEYHEAIRIARGEKGGRATGNPSKRTTPRRPLAERSPRELDTSPKTARNVETKKKHAKKGVSASERNDQSGSPIKRDKNRTQASPADSPEDAFSTDSDAKQDTDIHDDSDVDAQGGLYTCEFCGVADVFTQPELDRHYWLDCPMLTGCSECSHVIEISCISRHLVDECEHREKFVECDISFIAVREEELDTWQRSKSCKPPGKGGPHSICPLCLEDIGSANDKDLWRAHLMNVCTRNPRR